MRRYILGCFLTHLAAAQFFFSFYVLTFFLTMAAFHQIFILFVSCWWHTIFGEVVWCHCQWLYTCYSQWRVGISFWRNTWLQEGMFRKPTTLVLWILTLCFFWISLYMNEVNFVWAFTLFSFCSCFISQVAVLVSSSDAVQPGWLVNHLRSLTPFQIKELQKNLAQVSS